MANGTPKTDREWLMQISGKLDTMKQISETNHTTLTRSLNKVCERVDDHESRIAKNEGQIDLVKLKANNNEKGIEKVPSLAKIVGVISTLLMIVGGIVALLNM